MGRMNGNNTFHICQKEMIAAMQHYFDTVVFNDQYKAEVTEIKAVNKRNCGPDSFDVRMVDVVQEEETL